ncbi:uncharacterized protein LOC127003372 isoform X2 [Eriocheir sinensis]|uniref:uncharacterized protein LOC127003372 isoform X2 n=1 Tax=Eriocheir sinensis TaxID=95602 RepID=UPI0021CA7798|nr:uncharacterized protein LOC127003372 isoform X2 [Eriocheir sinensis]
MSAKNKVEKDKLLEDMAKDYAPYFQVDTTAETRTENRHTLDALVPQIYSNYQTLQRTFQTIDQLELLVGRVKEDLTKMEKAVTQGERDLGSNQGFTTVMKPFFFMREHIPERSSSQLNFNPPEIFKAEDYFAEATETDSSQPSRP